MTNKGFSLIELCIVIAILAILAGIFAPVIASGIDAWVYKIEQDELLTVSRLAIMRLTNELRWECTAFTNSGSSSSGDAGGVGATSTAFRFINKFGPTIDYWLMNVGTNDYQIYREVNDSLATRRVLLPYFTAAANVTFSYFKNNGSAWINGTDPLSSIALVRMRFALQGKSGRVIYLQTSVRPFYAQ